MKRDKLDKPPVSRVKDEMDTDTIETQSLSAQFNHKESIGMEADHDLNEKDIPLDNVSMPSEPPMTDNLSSSPKSPNPKTNVDNNNKNEENTNINTNMTKSETKLSNQKFRPNSHRGRHGNNQQQQFVHDGSDDRRYVRMNSAPVMMGNTMPDATNMYPEYMNSGYHGGGPPMGQPMGQPMGHPMRYPPADVAYSSYYAPVPSQYPYNPRREDIPFYGPYYGGEMRNPPMYDRYYPPNTHLEQYGPSIQGHDDRAYRKRNKSKDRDREKGRTRSRNKKKRT